MCTASWLIRPDGFELFFNRDESRQRGRARGPRVCDVSGRRAITPIDEDAGGTWIGVNDCGLAIGLLNSSSVVSTDEPDDAYRSRGLLVLDVLVAFSRQDVRGVLRAEELERYRGFRLLVIEPNSEPHVFAWDGRELTETVAVMPLSSSTFDAEGADRERSALLREMIAGPPAEATADVLDAFHHSHAPERGPFSPCMHRADARTVSASHVIVDRSRARFSYTPGPPCSTEREPAIELALSSPA